MQNWITQEKDEEKIFTKPRLSTHAFIGTAARKLASTDVDPPPQSVNFTRTASAFQSKGGRKVVTDGLVTPTTKPYASTMKAHPSNKKFEFYKTAITEKISSSKTSVGQYFTEKIDKADTYNNLQIVGKNKFKLEKRYCTRYWSNQRGQNDGKEKEPMQLHHGYYQNGQQVGVVKDLNGEYQDITPVYFTAAR